MDLLWTNLHVLNNKYLSLVDVDMPPGNETPTSQASSSPCLNVSPLQQEIPPGTVQVVIQNVGNASIIYHLHFVYRLWIFILHKCVLRLITD